MGTNTPRGAKFREMDVQKEEVSEAAPTDRSREPCATEPYLHGQKFASAGCAPRLRLLCAYNYAEQGLTGWSGRGLFNPPYTPPIFLPAGGMTRKKEKKMWSAEIGRARRFANRARRANASVELRAGDGPI